jgi:23S rRNA pseudouridine1911/1915/1917 synthase
VLIEAQAGDRGKRLDAFLHERLPEFSRSRLQSWIKSGRVLVNGATPRASYLVRGGDTVSVVPGELPPLRAEAEDLPLRILYEDDDVVVIDKPAGMVVHAGAGHTHGTLVNALLGHFGSLSSVNGDLRPGIVHRLDRDTSGVLVAARTDAAHQSLAQQFQARQVEKVYLALVHGRPRPAQGKITSPISRDPIRRTRMSTHPGAGRSALTDYRIIEDFSKLSLLEVRIGTGRTHQIRVHMASLGHPVFGDRLYGAPVAPGFERFFLHALRLRFALPSTHQPISIESPLPAELSGVLDSLRSEISLR